MSQLLFVVVACTGSVTGSDSSGSGFEDGRPELYINEFMASNTSTITDEAGAFPDWIEIYNASDATVDLGQAYITDDLDTPTKGPVSADLSIDAGGFLVFWADGDTMEGDLHLPFSLDAKGEALGIYWEDEDGLFPLDSLTYGEQTADVSAARVPDGSDNWTTTSDATPGSSNGE